MNDRRDTSPKNLDKLFGSMTGYIQQKKEGHKFTSGASQHVPDKYCPICATVFGLAPAEAPLTAKLCGICVEKLKAGQTALVCGNRHAFVEVSPDSVQAFARGRVQNISPQQMDALEQEHKGTVKTNPEIERKNQVKKKPCRFNIEGMKVGDSFMGCPKCLEQYQAGGVGPSKCGRCGADMRIYTVTKNDVASE